MSIGVDVKTINDVPVVEISGGIIDIGESKLSEKLESLYRQKHKKIIIDVSKANFINSHGIGIIMYYHNTMRNEDRELVILNSNPDPNAYVARLFKATKLYKVLRIATDIDKV